jgi:hypothetical protein
MGSLGWTATEALNTDPQTIALAWRGHVKERDYMIRSMFGAQGHKLDPSPPDEEDMVLEQARRGVSTMAERWKLLAQQHNASFKQRKRGMRPPRAPKPPRPESET